MRTIAYVDGQNFYYSCLKGTCHKWLDIEKLLSSIISKASPGSNLVAVKYFTSPIKGKFAKRGQASTDAQAEYLRALRANPRIHVREGKFSVESANVLRHVVPPDREDRVRIWRIEEKETDVALAVSMYRDARSGEAEQVVLVSNDSDMAPSLTDIAQDTAVRIGVILPVRQTATTPILGRRPSASLSTSAHWLRDHILDMELVAAQLPPCVQTRRRPARRPVHW